MKYISAKKKKLEKIRAMIQLEIKSGKCNQADVDDIVSFLKMTLAPWEGRMDDDSGAAIN
jgi:hypothetical protein